MILNGTRGALLGAFFMAATATAPATLWSAGANDGHTHDHGAGTEHAGREAQQLRAGAELIEARQLYIDRCAACHGPRGHGTDAARVDFSDAQALIRLTHEAMSQVVENGHDGLLDAPLTNADRETIIGYLQNYLMLPAPDADTDIGRAIYARSCSVCHGDRGDAASWAKNSLNPAPADFTSHGLEKLSREKMIEAVTFGSKNTAMMPFTVQLSHEEIAATVDYIRAAFMPEGMGPETAGHDHGAHDHADGHADGEDAPFPDGLSGDPVWGKAFYEDNCAECHGLKGDGEGRRAYFMIKKPKDFLSRDARSELTRPKLLEEITEGVIGTTMPSWGKVLTPQEIANVGEYVYRAFLHPDRFDPVEVPPGLDWKKVEASEPESKKN